MHSEMVLRAASSSCLQNSFFEHFRVLWKKAKLHDALEFIEVMHCDGLAPSSSDLYCLIQGCIQKKDLAAARKLYAYITKYNLHVDSFLCSHLIHMFSLCGSLSEAAIIFRKLPEPSVFAWTAIISVHLRHGHHEEALLHYQRMQQFSVQPDGHVFVAALKASASMATPIIGQLVHAHVLDRSLESHTFVGNTLIDFYFKYGCIEDAFAVFSRMQKRDVVTWNSFIAGLVHHEHCNQAFRVVEQMLSNGIEPNTVTWNTILSGYAKKGDTDMAFKIFGDMQQTNGKPDPYTFATAFKACASKGALKEGKWFHTQLVESGIDPDIQVGNALVDMYIKCGRMEDAYMGTHNLPVRDVVTWTAMITGYAELGDVNKAIQMLQEMHQESKTPDHFTFTSLLKACTSAAALNVGKMIHSYIAENGLELDMFIRSTLIDLYAKCASFKCAYSLFERLLEKDIVAWGALIGGLSVHGKYVSALECLHCMLQDGFSPNSIIVLSLLSACSQLGMADEGESLFLSMSNAHGLVPTLEQYNLVVDLLGRAGHLKKAEEILQSMPLQQANVEGWTSLLSSCWSYSNVQLGTDCFNKLVELNTRDVSTYILMSSIYIDANMLKEAEIVQGMLNKEALTKEAGLACVEVGNLVHDFCVGDGSHPQSGVINLKLRSLLSLSRKRGCIPAFV